MLAARYKPGQKELVMEEVEQPKPGYGEVVLKVAAAGICHSDLHILEGGFPFPQPFTMGHEGAGTVAAVGEGVQGLEQGAVYAVHGPNPCGNCTYCREGRDNLCNGPNRAPIGLGMDGAYAEYLKVPARNLIKVPAGVAPAVAAVATDAVLTPYHALKTIAGVRLGDVVLVIGLGGLGLNGVQVAKALGAYVIAVDVVPAKLEMARQLGANEVYEANKASEALKGRLIDVAADFVGIEATASQVQTLVKPGGTIVLVGLGALSFPLINARISPSEIKMLGVFWGTSLELHELLDLIAAGKIQPQVETYPLREVNEGLKKLRQGQVNARLALIP